MLTLFGQYCGSDWAEGLRWANPLLAGRKVSLRGLSERDIVVLDDERKAARVSNLLVVLCADKDTQPIIHTSTLYN